MSGEVMISHIFWQGLNTPYTRHPLFWRTIRQGGGTQFAGRNDQFNILFEWIGIGYICLIIGVWLLMNVSASSLQREILNLLLFLLTLPIWVVIGIGLRFTVFNGTVTGLLWAFHISSAIAQQRTFHTEEVLGVSPPGRLGTYWATCSGYLYRYGALHRYTHQRHNTLILALIMGGLLVMTRPIDSTESVVTAIAFIAAIYSETIHAVVMASLLGLVVPLYTHNTLDAQLLATGLFLLFQVFTVILTILTSLRIIPHLYSALDFHGAIAEISIPILSLLVFIVVRETIIIGLWRILKQQINIGTEDLRILSNRLG